jgi:hypothetical protein
MSAIKFVARQASSINVYKNLRSKTLKCNANIYFNKQCLLKKVIPKYASTTSADTSPAAQFTTKNIWCVLTDILCVHVSTFAFFLRKDHASSLSLS